MQRLEDAFFADEMPCALARAGEDEAVVLCPDPEATVTRASSEAARLAAEDRGDAAITSSSPYVSNFLEQGARGERVEDLVEAEGPLGEVSEAPNEAPSPAERMDRVASAMYRLWLTISCKNPSKGLLCEPAHRHCMHMYNSEGAQRTRGGKRSGTGWRKSGGGTLPGGEQGGDESGQARAVRRSDGPAPPSQRFRSSHRPSPLPARGRSDAEGLSRRRRASERAVLPAKLQGWRRASPPQLHARQQPHHALLRAPLGEQAPQRCAVRGGARRAGPFFFGRRARACPAPPGPPPSPLFPSPRARRQPRVALAPTVVVDRDGDPRPQGGAFPRLDLHDLCAPPLPFAGHSPRRPRRL